MEQRVTVQGEAKVTVLSPKSSFLEGKTQHLSACPGAPFLASFAEASLSPISI